jgi:hypothetical protein
MWSNCWIGNRRTSDVFTGVDGRAMVPLVTLGNRQRSYRTWKAFYASSTRTFLRKLLLIKGRGQRNSLTSSKLPIFPLCAPLLLNSTPNNPRPTPFFQIFTMSLSLSYNFLPDVEQYLAQLPMTLLRTMEEVSLNRLSLMSRRVRKACARFGRGTFLHPPSDTFTSSTWKARASQTRAARRRLLSLASSGRRQSHRLSGLVRMALQRADFHPPLCP